MKLASYLLASDVALGVVDLEQQRIVNLQQLHVAAFGRPHPTLRSMLDLIDAGDAGLDLAHELLTSSQAGDPAFATALADARLLAPIPRPTQLRDFSVFPAHLVQSPIALAEIALKQDPCAEFKAAAGGGFPRIYREEPVFYFSNRMSVSGHDAMVDWPAGIEFLDFELEMAVCIGKTGKNVPVAQAHEHIFGYTIFNDVSARDAQARQVPSGLGPCKGKSHDGCNILGPWIVTRDEMKNPYRLQVEARDNGEVWARSSTEGMLHSFEEMIAFASIGETIHAGEVFGSGTVAGCCSLELGRWMKPSDTIELEIEGIGTLRNRYGNC